MSEAMFPASVAAALDRLIVPPLPPGFAERLLQRLEAGDLPMEGVGELPQLRRPVAMRRWLRPGRIALGVAAFGVASATAAASGDFGEPVYVPMVSEALAKAEIVPLPVKPVAAPKPKVAVNPPLPQSAVKAEMTGTTAVRQLYQRLRSDREFRALPPRERTAIAREELNEMLRAGTIKPEDIRTVMRELREERIVKEEAAWRAATEEEPAAKKRKAAPKPLPGEIVAQRRAELQALPLEDKRRLFELRRALRTAPPEERPAIRREIREILQNSPAAPAPDEGNPETAR